MNAIGRMQSLCEMYNLINMQLPRLQQEQQRQWQHQKAAAPQNRALSARVRNQLGATCHFSRSMNPTF
eukprot:269292-Pelagomonas_calceolata.AAC.6